MFVYRRYVNFSVLYLSQGSTTSSSSSSSSSVLEVTEVCSLRPRKNVVKAEDVTGQDSQVARRAHYIVGL